MKRDFLVALGAGLVLSAIMSYPLIVRPGTVARYNTNDGRFSVWNVAWVAHALTDRSEHLFDANIFYPHTGTLAYSEANLVAGTLAVPVYAITGNPVASHNVVVYVSLVLAFLCMWALVKRLTGNALAGLVSATAFAFSTYVSAHTAHIQLLMIFVVPLALLDLHRFIERPSIRHAVGLGLAMAVAGLACGYYGIFSGLAVGLGLVWFAPWQRTAARYWALVLVAILVGGALVAPVVRPYAKLRRDAGFKSSVNLDEARMYSADGFAYLRSGTILHQAVQRYAPERLQRALRRDGEVLFPGVVAILLAIGGVATLFRGRGSGPRAVSGPAVLPLRKVVGFYLTLTLLAICASLGPDAKLYTWLADWVPMMSFLRAPARIGLVALCGIAVLAGFGAARLAATSRRAWIVVACLLVTAIELKASWPLVEVPEVPAVYRRLAQLPRGGVVELHFPYRRTDEHQHARYMFWSMWHWQPLVNGYSDYIPPDFYEIAAPINMFPDPESFRIMKARGVRYVIVHLDTYTEGPIRDAMIARFPPYDQYLSLLLQAENSRLYEIVRWPG